jgi:hypothetical protein
MSTLLSGGNPRIPKGDGDAPVQAYLAALPGWKGEVGRRLDALIVETVPGVQKAVKWNTPFYGAEPKSWFLAYHATAKYMKIAFFRGALLSPMPPVDSKDAERRYLHVSSLDTFDEAQFADWVRQARESPGVRL